MIHIPLGIYRHWTGGQFDVIGVALHEGTGEELVILRPMYGDDRRLRALYAVEFTQSVLVGKEPRPAYEMVLSNETGPVDRKQ